MIGIRIFYKSNETKGNDTMNNVRRKKLTEIYDKLDAIKSELEEVLDEEDTALDGVSENFVNRREQMEETIGALEDIIMYVDDSLDNLENILSN
ncbi:MAG: hypothetical protein II980_04065 [Clostridia bacterium]|nr:hypothetical protein [Clostridia bacterium]